MKKLPPQFAPVAFSFFMALTMSVMMSGTITLVNTGSAPGILNRWLQAWTIAFPIAFFVAYTMRPVVLKLVSLTVRAAPISQAN